MKSICSFGCRKMIVVQVLASVLLFLCIIISNSSRFKENVNALVRGTVPVPGSWRQSKYKEIRMKSKQFVYSVQKILLYFNTYFSH